MRKIILLGLLSAAAVCAQTISFGFDAGVPLVNAVHSRTLGSVAYDAKSLYFTVGPTFQLNFPWRLRLEIDALYRPVGYQASTATGKATASNWRFPVIMQYRLPGAGRVHPFVGAGASFEHFYQISNAVAATGTGGFAKNSPGSLLIDGGFDFKAPFAARLSLEGRYMRQFHDGIFNLSHLNQADILLGVHF